MKATFEFKKSNIAIEIKSARSSYGSHGGLEFIITDLTTNAKKDNFVVRGLNFSTHETKPRDNNDLIWKNYRKKDIQAAGDFNKLAALIETVKDETEEYQKMDSALKNGFNAVLSGPYMDDELKQKINPYKYLGQNFIIGARLNTDENAPALFEIIKPAQTTAHFGFM